jgi:hypothetical protein
MEKLLEMFGLLKGKTTYIIALAVAVLGALQGMDIFTVPDSVWAIVAALGLARLRAGVNKVAAEVKAEVKHNG